MPKPNTPPSTHVVTMSISLPPALMRRLKVYAKREGKYRSHIIAAALERYLPPITDGDDTSATRANEPR